MRIATWNINSVRLRKSLIASFLNDHKIDILCLQETKTEDEFFPKDEFEKIGYNHQIFTGQKSYNGVAVISKLPIKLVQKLELVNNDKRHLAVSFEYKKQNFELHNIYIPAGGDIPDVKENPKFDHKINYVRELQNYFKNNNSSQQNIIAVGDFNIAPYEHDVWSSKQLKNVVSHTPIEREELENFRKSIDFVDVARKFVPESEKLYSWWSYRNQDWKKSNRGRRLDHIWVSPALSAAVKNFEIARHARDFEQPSDHVPVIIEI